MFDDEIPKARSVSLTPLIDVVFLLLIFFMLASSFLQTQTLTMLTPAASTDEQPMDDAVVEVWLLANGTIKVDREEVALPNLKAGLKKAIGGGGDVVVSILAEEGSRVQLLVSAVEAAKEVGVQTVGTARVERLE